MGHGKDCQDSKTLGRTSSLEWHCGDDLSVMPICRLLFAATVSNVFSDYTPKSPK
jgi:hypothetical protein